MRTRFWLTSLITISLAAPAQAGTIEPGVRSPHGPAAWRFTAAPGERNDIVVERVPGRGVRLTDAAARPTGCPADGPNSVLCEDRRVLVIADDGDDTVVARPGTDIVVYGGDGNDHLVGTALFGDEGDDVLEGTAGDDLLDDGDGRDRVTGGAGDDMLGTQDADADQLDGGGGTDRLSYQGSEVGVQVDLGAGTGPNGDVITGIETLEGGERRDVLLGDDGPNSLYGGGGRDQLDGRGGDDYLSGEPGRDKLIGGDGADRMDGEDLDGGAGADLLWGSRDIRCGDGSDTVRPSGTPRLHPDCELAEGQGPSVSITRSRLILRWQSGEHPRPCRIRAVVDGRVKLLRRFNGANLGFTRPANVRIQSSRRCTGVFGDDPLAFRLTS